jgi:hypothetical protein
MNIIRRKAGGGFNIPMNGTRNVMRRMKSKIAGSGISNEMFEEIEKKNKGVNPDIVRKFEGLKLKGKPKKYISFN